MNRVLLQPAFILHRRSYRETSFLVDLFTSDYGRLTVLARGLRSTKSTSLGILQPFVPLLVSWAGKGELMTLTHIESTGNVARLRGNNLFAGLYLNELLVSLLSKWDAHPRLYQHYIKSLFALQAQRLDQKILRSFEKYLLEELGYGPLPKTEVSLHNMFVPDKYYRFIPDQGFVLSELDNHPRTESNIFSGKSLLAIAKEDWSEASILYDAKRLNRFILTPLLGMRPIYSRLLFIQSEEKLNE